MFTASAQSVMCTARARSVPLNARAKFVIWIGLLFVLGIHSNDTPITEQIQQKLIK